MSPEDLKALTSLLKAKQAGVYLGTPAGKTFKYDLKKCGLNEPVPLLGYPSGRVIAEDLGRGVVRETCSEAAAGIGVYCYVTQGVLMRDARVRVIRDGIVIYPAADGSARCDTLKRVNDDEFNTVGGGRECWVTIRGLADLRVGDVIEAFRLEGDQAGGFFELWRSRLKVENP